MHVDIERRRAYQTFDTSGDRFDPVAEQGLFLRRELIVVRKDQLGLRLCHRPKKEWRQAQPEFAQARFTWLVVIIAGMFP